MLLRPRVESKHSQLAQPAGPGPLPGGQHGLRPGALAHREAQAAPQEDCSPPQEGQQEARSVESDDRVAQAEAEEEAEWVRGEQAEESRVDEEDHR